MLFSLVRLAAGFVGAMMVVQAATAAELKVLTTPALSAVWHDLKPKFEAAGHKLDLVYAPGAAIAKRVAEGEAADVMFSTGAGIDNMIKSGKVLAGTGTPIASSGMGVAVLKGAPKPDISTPEKFKQALLAAKAVAYTDPSGGGASGVHLAKVLEKLGIAKEINAKARLGRGVPSATRQRDEVVERRRRLDQLRNQRTAPPHRDDDHPAVAGEGACHGARHRSLADTLAGADHGDRRQAERVQRRRVEAKVGADVRDAVGEEPAREMKPRPRIEHGLVRQVDRDLRVTGLTHERDAVVRRAAQLLGAADEHHADEFVRQLRERLPHDVRIVLPVDDRDGLHRLLVTSPSIRAVYFSYVFVSVENWMMRSWSWNG